MAVVETTSMPITTCNENKKSLSILRLSTNKSINVGHTLHATSVGN